MAFDAGVAVSGIGTVEFIAGPEPGEFRDFIDLVEERNYYPFVNEWSRGLKRDDEAHD